MSSAIFTVSLSLTITDLSGYNTFIPHFKIADFITCYIGIIVYVGNIFCWKIFKRTRRVKAGDMDLTTGRREFQEVEEMESNERK